MASLTSVYSDSNGSGTAEILYVDPSGTVYGCDNTGSLWKLPSGASSPTALTYGKGGSSASTLQLYAGIYDIIDNLFIFVGNDGSNGDAIITYNPSNNTVNEYLISGTSTYDILVSVAIDYANGFLYAGESMMDVGGTYYGSDIWQIPLKSILGTPGTITGTQVYTDSSHRNVYNLSIFNGNLYATLDAVGSTGAIVYASLSSLATNPTNTTWNTLVSATAWLDADAYYIAYVEVGTSNALTVYYSTNGSTWNSISTGLTFSGIPKLYVWGNIVVLMLDPFIYVVDLSNSTTTLYASLETATNYSSLGRRAYLSLGNVYFAVWTSAVPSYIYSLSLGANYTLSVNTNATSITQGNNLTINATLEYNTTPVSNATLYVYQVNGANAGKYVGTLLGTITTNTNGQGSLVITPTTTGTQAYYVEYLGG